MKGMQKIKRGNNFRGVLDYAFDRDKNEEKSEGVLVGGNMAGTNSKELTAEFLRFADARKDIQKPVWHNSLRLPEGDTLTDDEWNKVGFDYMERMGFDPNLNQYVFIKHDDKEGQHIHIIGSRIDMLGNVHLGRNENLISTRIISELEIEHNLTQTKNLDYTKDGQGNYAIAERSTGRGRTLSRAEELMQDRKQWNEDVNYLAPKQRLANAVVEAMENQPTTEQFINTLEAHNIQVQCVVKKGQMVGFSFAIDGENFKGSQVGANWKDITNERKLNYEQERDAEIISSRRYVTSSKQSTGVDSTPGANAGTVKHARKQRAVAEIGPIERDSKGRFIPSSQPKAEPVQEPIIRTPEQSKPAVAEFDWNFDDSTPRPQNRVVEQGRVVEPRQSVGRFNQEGETTATTRTETENTMANLSTSWINAGSKQLHVVRQHQDPQPGINDYQQPQIRTGQNTSMGGEYESESGVANRERTEDQEQIEEVERIDRGIQAMASKYLKPAQSLGLEDTNYGAIFKTMEDFKKYDVLSRWPTDSSAPKRYEDRGQDFSRAFFVWADEDDAKAKARLIADMEPYVVEAHVSAFNAQRRTDRLEPVDKQLMKNLVEQIQHRVNVLEAQQSDAPLREGMVITQ